jgi:hypothetical protein
MSHTDCKMLNAGEGLDAWGPEKTANRELPVADFQLRPT